MESIKETIQNNVNYIKDELIPGYLNGYRIVEDEKIICYFSKYSIDMNEFYEIFQFVEILKLNVFRQLVNQMKNCAKNIISFQDQNLSIEDKMILIFSACYYHYYMTFSYETDNTFEEYFNIDFLKQCESFKFNIISVTQFQIFAKEFYDVMQEKIKNLDYGRIKKYYKYYNPYIVDKDQQQPKKVGNKFENSFNFFNSNFMTKIMSVKQKLVDMICEIKTKSQLEENPKDANFISSSLEKMNEMSKEYLIKEIYNNSNNNGNNISTINNNTKTTVFKKRVLSEIVKYEIDNNTKKIVDEVSKKINDGYLDQFLNLKKNLDYQIMSYFVCYTIDFSSDFIKRVSGVDNISNNLSIRFVVPVKELYNFVMELFFSVSNLSSIKFENFVHCAVKKGIQMKNATYLYLYVKVYMKLSVEVNNVHDKIYDILRKFDEITYGSWERALNKRVEELSSQCSV